MARRTRFAVPLVVVLGCGRPAQTRQPITHDAPPVRTADPIEGASAADAAADSDVGANRIGSASRPVTSVNPPAPPPPVDGRVIKTTVSGTKIELVIGLRRDFAEGLVTKSWTGVFVSDDKRIAGSEFKLTSVKGYVAHAEIEAHELPSDTVRLFEHDYRK